MPPPWRHWDPGLRALSGNGYSALITRTARALSVTRCEPAQGRALVRSAAGCREAAFAERRHRAVTAAGERCAARNSSEGCEQLLGIAVPPAKTSCSARAGNAPAIKAAKGWFFGFFSVLKDFRDSKNKNLAVQVSCKCMLQCSYCAARSLICRMVKATHCNIFFLGICSEYWKLSVFALHSHCLD